jgi:hypothetical protein
VRLPEGAEAVHRVVGRGVVDLGRRQVQELRGELQRLGAQPAELLLQEVQRRQQRRALDRIAPHDLVELGLVLRSEHWGSLATSRARRSSRRT